ncbi:MAG: dTDP-glucose 4,6-dehydratase [Candidatus Kapaibacterium sp.]|nr:MAG: dTDP-glucose 4,6-dehydratase [Candidatus Kapabacteria bacterium]
MSKTVLVTGGAGFIGSNLIRWILSNRDWRVVNLDALTYAGNLANLRDVESDQRYRFVHGRIEDAALVHAVLEEHHVEGIIHCAAESHVDRSIAAAAPFIETNVRGTLVLLEAARKYGIERFIHVSTDEVYGTLGPDDPPFTEESPLAPNSPYAASKAGADCLVRAFVHTYGLPAIITRCSNNYGPFQFPEKLIPLAIANALDEQPIPIYGDGRQVRDWIYVTDHCRGLVAAYEHGRIGQTYNFGGRSERPNIDVVRAILRLLGRPESLIEYVTDRPGHDRRYAIDCSKAERELAWRPHVTFEDGLAETIAWYQNNRAWVDAVRSGEYRCYYEQQYGSRDRSAAR